MVVFLFLIGSFGTLLSHWSKIPPLYARIKWGGLLATLCFGLWLVARILLSIGGWNDPRAGGKNWHSDQGSPWSDENAKVVVLRSSVQRFDDLRLLLGIVFQGEYDYDGPGVVLSTFRPNFRTSRIRFWAFLYFRFFDVQKTDSTHLLTSVPFCHSLPWISSDLGSKIQIPIQIVDTDLQFGSRT